MSLRHKLTRTLQKVGWIYWTNNFVISSTKDFILTEAALGCELVPITPDNYARVQEFREGSRCPEYREKILRGEIGYFAEWNGGMVGSIWATINNKKVPIVARGYMELAPNEAMIHDIVTGVRWRGMGVGSFMTGRMSAALLNQFGVDKVIIDVSVRNGASLRMMHKAGLPMKEQVLYVSVFGNLIFKKALRN